MKNKIPLWINLSFWFFLCAGMIFDMLVVAVNWRSGELTDIKHLQDFFALQILVIISTSNSGY
ncbi:MAG: hypothetical protein IPP15_13525 [Saprospiraceae bacterium]|uniref:Uncharacterized protein n=1 Tax=Candidatus Opimibacter skivensis TaxID=2982028 RepID=A0A9D7SUL5_9BACT|nr:hypothetical protein [Candidatus Opimibacter skivensis]